MIRSFACPDTELLFLARVVPLLRDIERVARRKLLQLRATTELTSLWILLGISELVHGQCLITADTALRLAACRTLESPAARIGNG